MAKHSTFDSRSSLEKGGEFISSVTIEQDDKEWMMTKHFFICECPWIQGENGLPAGDYWALYRHRFSPRPRSPPRCSALVHSITYMLCEHTHSHVHTSPHTDSLMYFLLSANNSTERRVSTAMSVCMCVCVWGGGVAVCLSVCLSLSVCLCVHINHIVTIFWSVFPI